MIEIWENCKEHGLLIGRGGISGNVGLVTSILQLTSLAACLQVLRVKPPMCVTEEDAVFAVSVLKGVLEEYYQKRRQ